MNTPKTTNENSLKYDAVKPKSLFAQHMDRLNIKCPLNVKISLNVGESPEKIGLKKVKTIGRLKNSQSTPQLRGLLEKIKDDNIHDISQKPLLKLNSKKLFDMAPTLNKDSKSYYFINLDEIMIESLNNKTIDVENKSILMSKQRTKGRSSNSLGLSRNFSLPKLQVPLKVTNVNMQTSRFR